MPVPASDTLRLRLKARLARLVDALIDDPHPPQTLEQIEAAALRLREKAGQLVAEELTQEAADSAPAEEGHKQACACGRWARDKGRRTRTVVTLAAEVRYTRRYFYCRRCDRGACPVDAALGVPAGSGYTRAVEQSVARLCATLPFAPAMRLLSSLTGVSVSAKHAQRLVVRAGQQADALIRARAARTQAEDFVSPATPRTLYLEADGVHTPTRAAGGCEWREMKVGVVREEDAEACYVSHLGDANTFAARWAALSLEQGALTAERLVVLGDGAAWIGKQSGEHFPWATRILDFYHVCEYLWAAARAALGEAAGAWVAARKAELLHSRLEQTLCALSALAAAFPQAAEEAGAARGYFRNHRQAMDYALYLSLGLRIGSGAAESACKQVVTQRLKGAGMRWSQDGAQRVANLRCLLLSDRWESFQDFWNRQGRTAPVQALA